MALTVVGAAAMIALSSLKHARSPRPSTLLAAFLLLTALFDVVLTRTSWLARLQPWQTIDARIQTAAVALKVVILMAESKKKEKWIINWSAEEVGSVCLETCCGFVGKCIAPKLLCDAARDVVGPVEGVERVRGSEPWSIPRMERDFVEPDDV